MIDPAMIQFNLWANAAIARLREYDAENADKITAELNSYLQLVFKNDHRVGIIHIVLANELAKLPPDETGPTKSKKKKKKGKKL